MKDKVVVISTGRGLLPNHLARRVQPPPPKAKPQIVLAKAFKGIFGNFRGNFREFKGIPEAFFRKVPVSVKFLSAILGPEMAAPILWTPGKNAFFLQENPCP